jgi:hypothetical protein
MTAGQCRQLLADERPILSASRHIRVEAAVHLRHDNGDPHPGHITLNGGPAQPDRIIIGQAVQQIQRRVKLPA